MAEKAYKWVHIKIHFFDLILLPTERMQAFFDREEIETQITDDSIVSLCIRKRVSRHPFSSQGYSSMCI